MCWRLNWYTRVFIFVLNSFRLFPGNYEEQTLKQLVKYMIIIHDGQYNLSMHKPKQAFTTCYQNPWFNKYRYNEEYVYTWIQTHTKHIYIYLFIYIYENVVHIEMTSRFWTVMFFHEKPK